jgi:hypothetical protein
MVNAERDNEDNLVFVLGAHLSFVITTKPQCNFRQPEFIENKSGQVQVIVSCPLQGIPGLLSYFA